MRIRSVRAVFTGLQFALICSLPAVLFSQSKQAGPSGGTALTAYGACPALATQGIIICQPPLSYDIAGDAIPSPFQVIATGTSGTGLVTLMELWADGKKVNQTAGNELDISLLSRS